jgi:monothiol glutaredoxin
MRELRCAAAEGGGEWICPPLGGIGYPRSAAAVHRVAPIDLSPREEHPTMSSDDVQKRIEHTIKSHRVVLFMKGNRFAPSCGFSASVVGILDGFLPSYHTVDVLEDGAIREAVKAFSDWPTIPQLYVDGQFIGGADIVKEMHARGELRALFGADAVSPKQPTMTVSDEALRELQTAAKTMGADGSIMRMEISAKYEHDLYFGEAIDGDVVVDLSGLPLHLDPGSAFRADGVHIGFVSGPNGAGFKIDNPNEPARVRQIGPGRLKEMMDRGARFELVDVRTPEEWERASIRTARLLDSDLEKELLAMERSTPLVFQCHHGMRSLQAAEQFVRKGFRYVYNLQGGIDAWSTTVDPSVPRY